MILRTPLPARLCQTPASRSLPAPSGSKGDNGEIFCLLVTPSVEVAQSIVCPIIMARSTTRLE